MALGFFLICITSTVALFSQNPYADEVKLKSHAYIPAPTLSVESSLVQIRVVVRDSGGHVVRDLQKNDFKMDDNGSAQTISFFSVLKSDPVASAEQASRSDAPPANPPSQPLAALQLPRFVALFFDDMHTTPEDWVHVREAADRFIKQGLHHADKIGIFTASAEHILDFTDDPAKLQEAIARISAHAPSSSATRCPSMDDYAAYLIANNRSQPARDAMVGEAVKCFCPPDRQGAQAPPASSLPPATGRGLTCPQKQERDVDSLARTTWERASQLSQTTLRSLRAVAGVLARKPGDRTLVLVSPGFISGSLEYDQDSVLNAALRAAIVINSVDAKGLAVIIAGGSAAKRGNSDPQLVRLQQNALTAEADPMAVLSDGTGGRFFHNNNDLSAGLKVTATAPEVSYLLAFTPAELKPDGSYHKLKVSLASPGHFDINTRPGYFAPAKKATEPPPEQVSLDRVVMSAEQSQGIQAEIATRLDRNAKGEPILWVEVHVALPGLPFRQQGDRSLQTLTFVAALFDPNGNLVSGMQTVMDLQLKDKSLRELTEAGGINTQTSLRGPPGSYILREILQESVEGRVTAVSRPVEIR